VEQFRLHPRAEDAVALRQWDEAAKDAEDPGLPMAELLRVFDRYRKAQATRNRGANDIPQSSVTSTLAGRPPGTLPSGG
jgi:hypothetical protein